MADLITKSAVRNALADQSISSDFYDALNGEVKTLLKEASRRAEANERKTVEPRDL